MQIPRDQGSQLPTGLEDPPGLPFLSSLHLPALGQILKGELFLNGIAEFISVSPCYNSTLEAENKYIKETRLCLFTN